MVRYLLFTKLIFRNFIHTPPYTEQPCAPPPPYPQAQPPSYPSTEYPPYPVPGTAPYPPGPGCPPAPPYPGPPIRVPSSAASFLSVVHPVRTFDTFVQIVTSPSASLDDCSP
nr:unnamed protein product [Spirometra erinaceieuropaei]